MKFHTTLALMTTIAAPVVAQLDVREAITPTGWQIHPNQSVSDIQSWSAKGYRPIDCEIETTSPLRMRMIYIRNSGSYRTNWFMITNKSSSDVVKAITSSYRLMNLTPYAVGGAAKYCAIFVGNSGNERKSWYWWPSSSLAYIKGRAAALNARIIDFDTFKIGNTRYYSGVAIKNTGSDYRSHRVYDNQSQADIAQKTSQLGMRVYDLERESSGKYSVILVKPTQKTHSWWYLGRTMSELLALGRQNGARLFDVERYKVGNLVRYTGLMIQTTNRLTTDVGERIRANTDGSSGFVLKQLHGPTYASLQQGFVFDPASTLKQVHGAFVYWKARTDNSFSPNSLISFKDGPCPYTTGKTIKEKASEVVYQMLHYSDNRRTDAIERKWGKSRFHWFADNVAKLSNTRSNRTMGCKAPPYNTMTLADVVTLWEEISLGMLGSYREDFIGAMRNDPSYFPGTGSRYLDTILSNVRLAVGLTQAEYDSFRSRFRLAVKPGGKTINGKFHRTTSGWVQIGFVNNNAVENRQFAFGVFVHGASNSGRAENAVSTAAHALLKDRIYAAAATWKGFQFGKFDTFGTSCKVGSRTPSHTGSGIPRVGQTANYHLSGGPSHKTALMWIGASKDNWNGVNLPFPLIMIGAPGCRLYVSPDLALGGSTNFQGQLTFKIPLQISKAFVGTSFYTQFAMLAPGQNNAGFVTSNALETLIGGTK